MKRLGITQRVAVISAYNERRDCLDQCWSLLAFALGYLPVPLPNIAAEKVSMLLATLQLDGIVLSGGNSMTTLNPHAPEVAPERDEFEYQLIAEARKIALPMVGICRGMQVINMFLGGSVSPIDHHVACRHPLQINPAYAVNIANEVNSYHDWGIAANQLAPSLAAIATDQQGYIEGFVHKTEAIAGIMWHPEREHPFNPKDIDLLKKFLS